MLTLSSGAAAEKSKASLYDLILEYQRPRIDYYLKQLRDASSAKQESKAPLHARKATLSDLWLRQIPHARSRTWTDDLGNEFKIINDSLDRADAASEAAASGDSLENIKHDIDGILDKVNFLCEAKSADSTADTNSKALMDLMAATVEFTRSVRHRTALRSRLAKEFDGIKEGVKWRKVSFTVLMFLSRTHRAVCTFIESAEAMPGFQSIEWDPIERDPIERPKQLAGRSRSDELPLDALKHLGIEITDNGWKSYLREHRVCNELQSLKKAKRNVHAEVQLLQHHDIIHQNEDEAFSVHPYIGCSRRCCLLCYCFVRAFGGFRVRGTHETTMHRWALPESSLHAGRQSRFQSATARCLEILVRSLQDIFCKPFPLAHTQLLAQSSAALSTAKTVLDREVNEMEKSQLNTR